MAKRRQRNRDEVAKERLFREKGVVVNQPQPQPGEVVVTQTDLLAQIGALTMENTVLKNQLGQAQQFIQQQAEQIKALTPTVEEIAKDITAGSEDGPRLSAVERDPMPYDAGDPSPSE